MHLLARLAPLILALTLVSVSTHAGTIPVDAGLEPTNPEKPIDAESIALGSGFAAANGTTSVGPDGTVSAILRLLEDPPVPFFGLEVLIPYDPLTLKPVLIDEGDSSLGFQAMVLPLAAGSIAAAAPADSSTVRMILLSTIGIDGAAGDLVEVPLSVVAGSVEVPVSTSFTVVSVTDDFGQELPGANWPVLDVVLVPEPRTALLMACGLAGLALRRRSSGA